MSEFTKGEWKVKYYRNAGQQKHGDLITPDIMCNQERIASVCIYAAAQGNQEIADANARLIAAAPDLLDACEIALKESHNPKVENILEAAIAKVS